MARGDPYLKGTLRSGRAPGDEGPAARDGRRRLAQKDVWEAYVARELGPKGGAGHHGGHGGDLSMRMGLRGARPSTPVPEVEDAADPSRRLVRPNPRLHRAKNERRVRRVVVDEIAVVRAVFDDHLVRPRQALGAEEREAIPDHPHRPGITERQHGRLRVGFVSRTERAPGARLGQARRSARPDPPASGRDHDPSASEGIDAELVHGCERSPVDP